MHIKCTLCNLKFSLHCIGRGYAFISTLSRFLAVVREHNNLITIDKNRYLSEAGNRSARSHPFQYHRPNAYTDWLKFSFFPGQLQLGMDLQPNLFLRRQLMGLSPNYNDLWLYRDMASYACPWGLLANSFNCGGFVKDLYCYLFLVLFLSNLCATPTPGFMVKHDRVQYREKEGKVHWVKSRRKYWSRQRFEQTK